MYISKSGIVLWLGHSKANLLKLDFNTSKLFSIGIVVYYIPTDKYEDFDFFISPLTLVILFFINISSSDVVILVTFLS